MIDHACMHGLSVALTSSSLLLWIILYLIPDGRAVELLLEHKKKCE